MSDRLPYFKFKPAEYMAGNITFCSFETQGLFINLCSYYWIKSCSISKTNAHKRFSGVEQAFSELENEGVIRLETKDEIEFLIIDFLDEQMTEFQNISEIRRNSALKRGSKQTQIKSNTKAEQNPTIKRRGEERRGKEIRGDKASVLETFDNAFFEFWNNYPERNGKKVGKKETLLLFKKLAVEDLPRIIKNALNYGAHNDYAKDPVRFLRNDFWKDWDEPQSGKGGGLGFNDIMGGNKSVS